MQIGPENATDSGHTEGRTTNVDDHELAANYDGSDAQKLVEPEHAFKDWIYYRAGDY
jgi:hypothetical protein